MVPLFPFQWSLPSQFVDHVLYILFKTSHCAVMRLPTDSSSTAIKSVPENKKEKRSQSQGLLGLEAAVAKSAQEYRIKSGALQNKNLPI